jgi:hypothetical protein
LIAFGLKNVFFESTKSSVAFFYFVTFVIHLHKTNIFHRYSIDMASDLYKDFHGYPHFCVGATADRSQIQPQIGQILACQSPAHTHLLVFAVIESQTKSGKYRIKELNRIPGSSKRLFIPGTEKQEGPGWLVSFKPDKLTLEGPKGWLWWHHDDGLQWICKCAHPCSPECERTTAASPMY